MRFMSSPPSEEEFNWQVFTPEQTIDEQRPPQPSYQQGEIMPDSAMDTSAELPIEQQKVFPSTSTSMDVSMTWMAKVGSFSGPHKNIMEPRELVDRFETAIMQGNWTNKVSVANFGQVLQGPAKMWYANTLIEHPNKSKLWMEVKRLFQEEFQAKSTNTETRNQLNKLRQEKDESVQTFSFRVQYIINSLFPVPKLSENPSELQLGIAKVMKERNLLEMTVFFSSGLKADIRRACEAMPGFETFDWRDTVLAARKHEKILSGDEKSLAELKQNVGEEDVDKQLAAVELFKKELMAKKHGGNATNWRGNGNRGFGNRRGRGRGGNNGGQKRRIRCYRCQKWGTHIASKCPVPQNQLSELKADDETTDPGTPHPFENPKGTASGNE